MRDGGLSAQRLKCALVVVQGAALGTYNNLPGRTHPCDWQYWQYWQYRQYRQYWQYWQYCQ